MRVLALSTFLACILGFAPCEGRDFSSSDVEPADSPTVQAVRHMGELLSQQTGDRLRIGSLGSGSKNSESFTVAAVRAGTLDMARVSVTAFNDIVPESVVSSLPFLFRSAEHAQRAWDGAVGQAILAALGRQDIVGLCIYDTGMRSIYSRRIEIHGAADVKGLKLRIQASSAIKAALAALDVRAEYMPFNQVRAGLSSGVINAAENNIASFVAAGHHEVAKVYSLTRHSASPAVVIFSRRTWDGLSAADQEALRAAARQSVAYFQSLWREHEDAARRTFLAAGGRFVEDVDLQSFRSIVEPLYPKLVPDGASRRLVELVKAAE